MPRPSDLVDAAYNLGLYEALARVADDLEEAAMNEFFEGEQEKAYILRDLYNIWRRAAIDQAPVLSARSFNTLKLRADNWELGKLESLAYHYTQHTKPEPGEEVLGWSDGVPHLVQYDEEKGWWGGSDLLFSLEEIPVWQKLVPPK